MNYHIIGKSNNLISILIDTLYEIHKPSFKIQIVKNIPVGEYPPYQLENIKSIVISSINDIEWDGNFNKLLMGVIRVHTKSAVYNSFFNSHKIPISSFDIRLYQVSI